jgi:hypothetical protein
MHIYGVNRKDKDLRNIGFAALAHGLGCSHCGDANFFRSIASRSPIVSQRVPGFLKAVFQKNANRAVCASFRGAHHKFFHGGDHVPKPFTGLRNRQAMLLL